MKKILALLLALLFCTGCACAELDIACSIFPQYDFTLAIAGQYAAVTRLLPPGMDSHEYEPSVRDILALDRADLFIYTDEELEQWVKTFEGSLTHVKSIRCAEGIDLAALNEKWEEIEHHGGEEEHGHEHEHEHAYDAHIWLDPTLAVVMAENIRDALIEADPAHEAEYTENCAVLVTGLTALDSDFTALFEQYPDAKLYFGGKFAYSHFLRHYHLDYLSAYDSCSDEGEPGARVIMNMVRELNAEKAAVIFTDEMSSGEVARAIAEETGCKVLLFHSCHNVSAEDENETYLSLMRKNYENIKTALMGE